MQSLSLISSISRGSQSWGSISLDNAVKPKSDCTVIVPYLARVKVTVLTTVHKTFPSALPTLPSSSLASLPITDSLWPPGYLMVRQTPQTHSYPQDLCPCWSLCLDVPAPYPCSSMNCSLTSFKYHLLAEAWPSHSILSKWPSPHYWHFKSFFPELFNTWQSAITIWQTVLYFFEMFIMPFPPPTECKFYEGKIVLCFARC